ncbi:hypothetical protein [Microcoleus sp. OTE_8_concoct_300]|uniref:hypothetical protein n=1 Tax=Microcoleus sp. OTE_8_concoct_300 TaxID=2964710 RepID=UPI00403FC203
MSCAVSSLSKYGSPGRKVANARSPEPQRRKILPLTDKFCDRTSPAIPILV